MLFKRYVKKSCEPLRNVRLYNDLLVLSGEYQNFRRRLTLGLKVDDTTENDLNYRLIGFCDSLKIAKEKDQRKKLILFALIFGAISIVSLSVIHTHFFKPNDSSNFSKNEDVDTQVSSLASPFLYAAPYAVKPEEEAALTVVNSPLSPISFNTTNKENVISLVYYSEKLERRDTFQINADYPIDKLKYALIEHYRIYAYRSFLMIERKTIDEELLEKTLEELIEQDFLNELDEVSILAGILTQIDTTDIDAMFSITVANEGCFSLNCAIGYSSIIIDVHTLDLSILLEGAYTIDQTYPKIDIFSIESIDSKSPYDLFLEEQDKGNYRIRRLYNSYPISNDNDLILIITSKYGIIKEDEIYIIIEEEYSDKFNFKKDF